MDARDPERDGLRRAVRAAVVVPIAAAVSFGIADSQTPLFTIISMSLFTAAWPGIVHPERLNSLSIFGALIVVCGSTLTALGGRAKGVTQEEASLSEP